MTGNARARALERGINEIDIERIINSPVETMLIEPRKNDEEMTDGEQKEICCSK